MRTLGSDMHPTEVRSDIVTYWALNHLLRHWPPNLSGGIQRYHATENHETARVGR